MGRTAGDPSIDPSHCSVRHTEQCVQCGSSVQVPEMLSNIGVPIIISQEARNIGLKLVTYWPTSKTLEIQYTNAGPMQLPICRFQIMLSRRPESEQFINLGV